MTLFNLPSPAGTLTGIGLATESTLASLLAWFVARQVIREDGQAALAVDTEISIDNATLKINNLFVASTDGLVGGSDYMRMTAALLADNFTPPISGLLQTQNFLYGFDPTSTDYDRLRAEGNDSDALATLSAGVLDVNSFLMGFNGTTWDRLVLGFGTASDGLRTIAQVGNATGAADFNVGSAGEQTQRVVVSTTARTAAKSTVSGNGSVSAGAQSVTFITDGTFAGTIAGDTVGTNTRISFSVNGNDTLGAIVYTVSAGNMQILTVT